MAHTRMPHQLQRSWLHGKAAAKIRWGTPGDWTRAYKFGVAHGMSPRVAKGVAQTMHKKATGMYTGDRKHLGKKKRKRKGKKKGK